MKVNERTAVKNAETDDIADQQNGRRISDSLEPGVQESQPQSVLIREIVHEHYRQRQKRHQKCIDINKQTAVTGENTANNLHRISKTPSTEEYPGKRYDTKCEHHSQNIRNNYLEGPDSWASIVTDLRRNIEKRFGENNK